MIDIRTASLVDFLPESISDEADIVALSLAIDPELRAVGAAIVEALILPNIDAQPVEVLDALAWGFRLDELQLWDTATLDGKRALIKSIFAIRKKSGTVWAVKQIFNLLSVIGKLVEWFEEGAPPYTYRLIIVVSGDPGLTLQQLLQVPELTHRFAPASRHLTGYTVEADQPATLYPYVAPTTGRHVTIGFGV